MKDFSYERATSLDAAVQALTAARVTKLIAGGTNVLDLLKEGVEHVDHLVDINHLDLHAITPLADGGLRLGALASNSAVASHADVQRRYPVLAEAILAGASPQLRNMATVGGNLLQRTRCYYFYDPATPCNKRHPGSGCAALHGVNRIHAILGASEQCIAVHPSDMCVALAALAAVVQITGPRGERSVAFADFHRLPGDQPERDTQLAAGEVITSVDLPVRGFAQHFAYCKARERSSYAFALASAAVALEMDADRILSARIALGGVAAKPWRRPEVEQLLCGQKADPALFDAAAAALLAGAQGRGQNDYKIKLAANVVVRALHTAAARKELL